MRPSRSGCVLFAVLPAFALAVGPVRAQSASGSVRGTVVDPLGAAVRGAAVTIQSLDTGVAQVTLTDRTGDFRLLSLTPGAYTVRIEAPGFALELRERVVVTASATSTLRVGLRVAGVEETVHVAPPPVDTTSATLGRVLRPEEVARLPVEDRDFAALARLTPGVTTVGPWISASGQNIRSNRLLVDGLASDSVQQSLPPASVPLDAIREFAVVTNGFAAEFGGASGAVVSVVTRSGANWHEGRAYHFRRDAALDARPGSAALADLDDSPFEQRITGGFVGGPLRRGRAFYFGSWEHRSTDTEWVVRSGRLPLFRPGQGPAFPTSDHGDDAMARVEVRVPASHLVSIRPRLSRLAQQDYSLENVPLVLPERTADFLRTWTDVGVAHAWTLGPKAFNELRVQAVRLWYDVDAGDRCHGCPSEDRPGLLLGATPIAPQDVTETRWEVADTFTLSLPDRVGDHTIKAGFDVSLAENWNDALLNGHGTFVFRTDAPYDPANPATHPLEFRQTFGESRVTISQRAYAAFLQDEWRPRPALTLHLGARWDHVDGVGLSRRATDVAPRMGLAFAPGGHSLTVLRASAGRYFASAYTQFTRGELLAPGQTTLRMPRPPYRPWLQGTPFENPLASGEGSIVRDTQRVVTKRLPYADEVSVGVERGITPTLVASAGVVGAKGYRLLVKRDQNYPRNVGVRPFDRPDPTLGKVEAVESIGHSWYRALLVGVEKRFARGHAWSLAYTWSSSERTTEGHAFVPQDHRDPGAERGPADSDARHQLVAAASVDLPLGFRFATVVTARSGLPYNLTTRDDAPVPDDYPNTDRPSGIGRNSARGDDFWQIDARVSKTLDIGMARMEFLVEAFNVANHRNWIDVDGRIPSPTFGRALDAAPPRRVQLGLRVDLSGRRGG